MKRKYAAMVLGLALTLTSMNIVYATDSAETAAEAVNTEPDDANDTEEAEGESDAADTNTDSEVEESTEEIYGKVEEVNEDGVTISVGKLQEPEIQVDLELSNETEIADEENAESENADEENAENEDFIEKDGAFFEEGKPLKMNLTGEKQAVKFTEATVFDKEVKPSEFEAEVEVAEDVAEAEAEVNEEAENIVTEEKEAEESQDAEAEETQDAEAEESKDAEAEESQGAESQEMEILVEEYAPELDTEAIALSDINVGDIVKITFDADGNAEKITVLNAEMIVPKKELSDETAPSNDTEETSSDQEAGAENTSDTEEEADSSKAE